MGLPYSKFYWADYLRDTRILSLEARGAWMDILCHLSIQDDVGVASYKLDSWGRLLGVTKRQMKKIFQELTEAKVGVIHEENGKFFVKNNRLCDDFVDFKNEMNARKKGGQNSAKKQRKLREINKTTPAAASAEQQLEQQDQLTPSNNSSGSSDPSNPYSYSPESYSLSKEKESGTDAAIPTLEEVLAEAAQRGIPEEHARSFFEYTDNNNLWLNKFGQMTKWRGNLKTWSERRRTFKANGKGKPSGQDIDRSQGTANEGVADQYDGMGQMAGN